MSDPPWIVPDMRTRVHRDCHEVDGCRIELEAGGDTSLSTAAVRSPPAATDDDLRLLGVVISHLHSNTTFSSTRSG